MTLRARLLILVWLLLACSLLTAQDRFYLKDGDRVVFYGDSITDQRLYTTFVESYVITRFPGLSVSFVHSGWGGDRVTGGGGGKVDIRLERDIIAYKPTVVTVMLGMNDGRYKAFDEETFETYRDGCEGIVKKLKAALPGLRMTLIQPSPYDDVTREPLFEGGYNAVLLRYAGFLKELARREGLQTADLNTPVVSVLKKAFFDDPANAKRILPDRVHPGAAGHLLMAAALLKSWDAPGTVSIVRINAARKRVEQADNSKVAELADAGEGIAWTQTDAALPLPIDLKDAVLLLALRSSDVIDTLDRQTLAVNGLRGERYALKIDGEEVGTFGSKELAAGLNLATVATPMLAQARQVHDLTLKHNTIHYARWRQVQVPLEKLPSAEREKAADALDALDNELVRAQRAAAQPKPHRFELIPAAP